MNGTQTLSRALDILFVLAEASGTMTVGEIAEKVAIPESTAYRLLQTLEQNGIVERKSKGNIGLGLRIFDLARSLSQQMNRDLLTLALPVMEELTKTTNETSVLFIRSGINAICVQNVKSGGLIQFSIDNGRILPLYMGASGKAILAYESDKLIGQVLEKLSGETARRELLEELASIREKGCCVTHGEVDPDVFAAAAPILDSEGRIMASLSVAGPYYRFKEENASRIIEAVVQSAEHISRTIGNLDC